MAKKPTFLKRFLGKVLRQIKKLINYLKPFYEKNRGKIGYLGQFVFVVIIYGLLVAFILNQFLGWEITIPKLIAYGLCFYIVKVEIPNIIKSSFPRKIIPLT